MYMASTDESAWYCGFFFFFDFIILYLAALGHDSLSTHSLSWPHRTPRCPAQRGFPLSHYPPDAGRSHQRYVRCWLVYRVLHCGSNHRIPQWDSLGTPRVENACPLGYAGVFSVMETLIRYLWMCSGMIRVPPTQSVATALSGNIVCGLDVPSQPDTPVWA